MYTITRICYSHRASLRSNVLCRRFLKGLDGDYFRGRTQNDLMNTASLHEDFLNFRDVRRNNGHVVRL